MKQLTFAGASFTAKKRQTRREKFLFEMEQVVPWAALLELIRPHYPQSGRRGRQPMPLEAMLRIYFLQNWFNLSDPAVEEAQEPERGVEHLGQHRRLRSHRDRDSEPADLAQHPDQ